MGMRDHELLGRLLSDTDTSEAWEKFLLEYSRLFLKIIWQFEHNRDEVMERYLFVCEKLARNRFAILRRFNPTFDLHPPKLSTWLTIVVRNLCIEGHRSVHGRKRFPLALQRMTEFDRKVFELRYWKGYTPDEIEEALKSRIPGLDGAVGISLSRIEEVFTTSRISQHSRDLPPTVTLETLPLLPTTDDTPEHSQELEQWFEEAARKLSTEERLVVRLRFWEDLTASEISGTLHIRPIRRVYSILEKALDKLREEATKNLER